MRTWYSGSKGPAERSKTLVREDRWWCRNLILEDVLVHCGKALAWSEIPKTQPFFVTFEVMTPGLESFLEGLATRSSVERESCIKFLQESSFEALMVVKQSAPT